MNKPKRILSLCLTLVLLSTTICGCGQKNSSAEVIVGADYSEAQQDISNLYNDMTLTSQSLIDVINLLQDETLISSLQNMEGFEDVVSSISLSLNNAQDAENESVRAENEFAADIKAISADSENVIKKLSKAKNGSLFLSSKLSKSQKNMELANASYQHLDSVNETIKGKKATIENELNSADTNLDKIAGVINNTQGVLTAGNKGIDFRKEKLAYYYDLIDFHNDLDQEKGDKKYYELAKKMIIAKYSKDHLDPIVNINFEDKSFSVVEDYEKDEAGNYILDESGEGIPVMSNYPYMDVSIQGEKDKYSAKMGYEISEDGEIKLYEYNFKTYEEEVVLKDAEVKYFDKDGNVFSEGDGIIYAYADSKDPTKGLYSANTKTSKVISTETKELNKVLIVDQEDNYVETVKYVPKPDAKETVRYEHSDKGLSEIHEIKCSALHNGKVYYERQQEGFQSSYGAEAGMDAWKSMVKSDGFLIEKSYTFKNNKKYGYYVKYYRTGQDISFTENVPVRVVTYQDKFNEYRIVANAKTSWRNLVSKQLIPIADSKNMVLDIQNNIENDEKELALWENSVATLENNNANTLERIALVKGHIKGIKDQYAARQQARDQSFKKTAELMGQAKELFVSLGGTITEKENPPVTVPDEQIPLDDAPATESTSDGG